MPIPDHAATLLDPRAMLSVLRRALPELGTTRSLECRIHQSRRRISRKTEERGAPYLGIVYSIVEVDAHASRATWCYAKAYSRGESTTALAAARIAAYVPPPIHLVALDTLLWRTPSDPAITQLAAFLDPACVERILPERDAIRDVHIVRYEPESHCTAKFEISGNDGAQAVFGKCYADDAWAIAGEHARELHRTGVADTAAFAIATPVAFSAGLRAYWQTAVTGVALRALISGSQASLWVERIAAGLVALQSTELRRACVLSPQDLLARTDKQCRKLASAETTLAADLAAALGRLHRARPDARTAVTVHGDFHLDQMIAAAGRVYLFDYDNIAIGSPMQDLADVLSQLLTDEHFADTHRYALGCALIERCRGVRRRGADDSDLAWHLRLHLLRKAYSFFVRHRSDWRVRARNAARLASTERLELLPAAAERAA